MPDLFLSSVEMTNVIGKIAEASCLGLGIEYSKGKTSRNFIKYF
jgi:hypothetical protein